MSPERIDLLYENIYDKKYLYNLIPKVVGKYGKKLGFKSRADVVDDIPKSILSRKFDSMLSGKINPMEYNIFVIHIECESDVSILKKSDSIRRTCPGKIVAETSMYDPSGIYGREKLKPFIENHMDAYVGSITDPKNFEDMLKQIKFL